jgi:hypothetical protein
VLNSNFSIAKKPTVASQNSKKIVFHLFPLNSQFITSTRHETQKAAAHTRINQQQACGVESYLFSPAPLSRTNQPAQKKEARTSLHFVSFPQPH